MIKRGKEEEPKEESFKCQGSKEWKHSDKNYHMKLLKEDIQMTWGKLEDIWMSTRKSVNIWMNISYENVKDTFGWRLSNSNVLEKKEKTFEWLEETQL